MVVLNGKTVDLADLFGGEYWSHEGDDNRANSEQPPRPPAAAPTVRIFQDV